MKARKLKLYVWNNVLTDWTSGVMFALARSPEHARKIILAKSGYDTVRADLEANEPEEVTKAEGFMVWGGG